MQAREGQMQSIQDFTSAATNMFDAIVVQNEDQSKKMVENMLTTLDANGTAMEQYHSNLEGLKERFTNLKLDDAVLQQFAAMGPEGIPYIEALVHGSDEQLQQLAGSYDRNVKLANEAGLESWETANPKLYAAACDATAEMERGITEGGEDVADAAENVVKNTQSAAFGALQQLDFNPLGRDFCLGFADAIKSNGSIITTAVQNVTKAAGRPVNPNQGIFSSYGLGAYSAAPSLFALDQPFPLSLLSAVEEEGPALMNMVAEARNALDYNQAHVGLSQSAFGWATSAFTASLRPSVQETNNNFYQTIHTHDSLSPAEMTREAQTFLRRAKWKLP